MIQWAQSTRIFASIVAIVLGWFLVGWASETWSTYWVMKDGQAGTAVVTNERWTGHNVVDYRYTVNAREYTGTSRRNEDDPKYIHVAVGQSSAVYFSASHPWLSLLYKPDRIATGLPVILLVLALELLAVLTIVKPTSPLALNFSGDRRGALPFLRRTRK